MINKVLKCLSAGLAIGSVVSVICLYFMNGADGTLKQMAAWLTASALYGIISIIYENDSVSFPLLTAIHMVLCAAVTLITAYLLGYASSFFELAVHVLPLFVIIYIIISAALHLYGVFYARKVSEKLGRK